MQTLTTTTTLTVYAVMEQYESPRAYFTTREAAEARLSAMQADYAALFAGEDEEYIPRMWVEPITVEQ